MQADTDAWLRFYSRREAECFGPKDDVVLAKRSQVLAYIARHCPDASRLLQALDCEGADA